ncbi:N-acetylglucosamine-specific PTS transporter subunit IIBC [Staphylococcus carnosus]|uniref:PTS glucose transporter subunit IIBC n=1 Tax=Staphylococcus carnosus TaxID=1281 RepID=A0AAJ0JQM9_STACA|nr:N-acetylglucosamine-specific PTS transporter subunit IIBC [Staphylococcus carnosus]KKB26031.1 PTS glucose transporter subunit IIBC [Staphylococcus carnosus]POA00220.1 PTS glucose transporter subunit IIBC [Staphylococcus carnosus]QQS84996.1 PTS transporter subunit EIIC [Staphylococcus carnosus]QRQ04935.1 PTS transporter subunit EIIC [Staphylococcus carnosus]UTB83068.1 PTS glucose transporter subunit IIBC [Staphylococcus carnosus]
MFNFLQRLGRSLMLPVAVLPAAAILIGIGNAIKAFQANSVIGQFIFNCGFVIMENLGILFAIGVALGMAKKNDGAVTLAAVVGFFVVTGVLSPDKLTELLHVKADKLNEAFTAMNGQNVFVGLIVGLVAAYSYNKFSGTELPTALSFFSGKRLVPIMTALFSSVVAIIFFFVWPFVYDAIVAFGKWIINFGPFGAFLYGFFNRLLIPTGLHHALNSVFWFNLAGIDDVAKFQTGHDAVKGITGRYMAGFFPVMMFGIPAAALAMYHTAKTEQKKRVAGLMLAGSISAFFVGVTEPIEFAFMFVAPVLFVIHALLTGLSLFIAAIFHWTAGFAFSAGLIDFVLSLLNPVANHPMMLMVQGLVFFVIYYVVFRAVIQIFNLNTPGRGDDEIADPVVETANGAPAGSISSEGEPRKYEKMSSQIIEGLGGKENITSLTNCATRLRLEVADINQLDKNKITQAGAVGVTTSGQHNVQVIIGTQVQQVADEVELQMETN